MDNQTKALSMISVEGYKSIKSLVDFELKPINIFIGANGVGKSNFISIFNLLANIFNHNLNDFVKKSGGPDNFLHYGRKNTEHITFSLLFEPHRKNYFFSLKYSDDNSLYIDHELNINQYENESDYLRTVGNFLSGLDGVRLYHFHDTSRTAKVKGLSPINDNLKLKEDAENLAPYLLMLKTKYFQSYKRIINSIQLIAPYFGDFIFRENDEYIQLEWKEKGNLDTPFKAKDLSDGTLRFICLATLLLQPKKLMPQIIIIDEPELGLHPYAIRHLASLIKRASDFTQLIIATQSVELINHFEPEDIIVTNKINNASEFKRLDSEELSIWLEDYSVGDLWKSNLIQGTPR